VRRRAAAEGGAPPLIAAAGLFSSGSTWAFNVLRAVLQRRLGADGYSSLYADLLADPVLASGKPTVIKCHQPSAGLAALLGLLKAPVALTIRDPRDAVASLVQRFDQPVETAIAQVARSAFALAHLHDRVPATVLRYEDGFSGSADAVRQLADLADAALPSRDLEVIGRALSATAVKAFIDRRVRAITTASPADQWDAATHWHPNHLGDGAIGKYAHVLTPRDAARISYLCREYRRRFGYPAAAAAPYIPGTDLEFSAAQAPYDYLGAGFGEPEAWGVWTITNTAELVLPLSRPLTGARLKLAWRLSPVFVLPHRAQLQLSVNGKVLATLTSGAEPLPQELDVLLPPAREALAISLEFSGLRTAADLGFGDDPRLVGAGLTTLRVDP
jgi:hypothetical protein